MKSNMYIWLMLICTGKIFKMLIYANRNFKVPTLDVSVSSKQI